MKLRLYVSHIAGILAAIACFAACSREHPYLSMVDEAIRRRPEYEAAHRQRLDSLEMNLQRSISDSARFMLLNDIYQMFKCNDLDSADFYAAGMSEIRDDVYSRSAASFVLASRRNYHMAMQMLDALPREDLSDGDMLVLCDAYQSVCSAANNDSGLSDDHKAEFLRTKLHYQNLTLTLDGLSPYEKLYYHGRSLASQKDWEEAVVYLNQALALDPEPQKALHCTYTLSNCYKALGMTDEFLQMLCRTAVLDLRVCNRQYKSLYDLSTYLYQHNNPEKASAYIQTTIIDAIQCNYTVRIVNAVDANNIISAMRESRERNTRIMMLIGIALLLVFSSVTFMQYLRIVKKSRELKAINGRMNELNAQLSSLNKSLQEEGVIKDKCLFRYMTLTVRFIDNIEDYRRLLRKTLKEQGIDALKEKLSQQDYLYMQYDTFYKLFDEIFMSIFPGFIDRVNAILPEGEKYELKKDGSFPTELRILAVMRLGITKSSRIAEFLNCPVGSVYTNKANLKVKLGCEDISLEQMLLNF